MQISQNQLAASRRPEQACREMGCRKLEYRLVGTANNVHVEVFGNGTLDPRKRSLAIALSCAWPALTLDPAIVLFGGLDWLLVQLDNLAKDDPVVVRTLTQVLDDDGREALESTMLFTVNREGSRQLVHGELARCVSRLEIGERVMSVGCIRAVRVPGTKEECVVTSVGTFTTGRGHDYRTTSVATIGVEAANEHDRPLLITSDWCIAERAQHAAKISANARDDGASTTRRP